jgi:hypothetical protein
MRIDASPLFELSVAVLCLILAPSAGWAGPFDDPGHLPWEMTAWATAVDEFVPGPVDVADPELGLADFGLPALVLGPSETNGGTEPGHVASLGDGGFITLEFETGIGYDLGNDFAIFENGFLDSQSGLFFGEFAFVEVSSNGFDFVRFPSTSLQASPVGSFGVVDPSDYHNLAGDQLIGYGTGFDLGELWDHPLVQNGTLLLTDVRFVRIVDVIGDGSTLDAADQPIYDPYETAFPSGGFDAEAVGVLHSAPEPKIIQLLAVGVVSLIAAARARDRRKNLCDPVP